MARRGGIPGGGVPGSMNNLMKQAQKMQKQMAEQAKEFETKTLLEEAKSQGVPIRTAGRWNDRWVEEGVVVKIRQGHYRKILASA